MRKGFTLLEIIIYIAILSMVLSLASSVMFYFAQTNAQTKGDREVLENARRALEIMTYEINGAKSIYTPTTLANQLSLETGTYLPTGESTTYIDFFICEARLCMKKESQNPIFLTSETVQVGSLMFAQISTNGFPSVQISLTVNYTGTINGFQPSTVLTSTASLRSY